MHNPVHSRATRLFILLGGFFIANALIAEFIGIKIFSLEDTLHWQPFNWNLWGIKGSLQFTAGVLLWPVVFIMTDIINEYFGKRGVQFLSFLTMGLIAYAFLMVFAAIQLAPASWWIGTAAANGVPNMQAAFQAVFGQGLWIIGGSLAAFGIGQIVDVFVFHRIKRLTGEKYIAFRATGSTLVSQFIDSYVVLYIAFVLNPETHWSIPQFIAIGTVNYLYKFITAMALTPLIYGVHWGVEAYLGADLAAQMKSDAAAEN
jgi:hypothetical protein